MNNNRPITFIVITLAAVTFSCGKKVIIDNHLIKNVPLTKSIPIKKSLQQLIQETRQQEENLKNDNRFSLNQIETNKEQLLSQIKLESESIKVENLIFKYANNKYSKIGCGKNITLQDILVYGNVIEKLGGKILDPANYSNDLIGFQKFLNESGIHFFTANEITKINNPQVAKNCNTKILLPPQGCWLRSSALALIGDNIRSKGIFNTVSISKHYENKCYNSKVNHDNNITKDYQQARAIQLKFKNNSLRLRAMEYLCQKFWRNDFYNIKSLSYSTIVSVNTVDGGDMDNLNISLGFGNKSIHISLESTQGRQFWVNSDLRKLPVRTKSCWWKKRPQKFSFKNILKKFKKKK